MRGIHLAIAILGGVTMAAIVLAGEEPAAADAEDGSSGTVSRCMHDDSAAVVTREGAAVDSLLRRIAEFGAFSGSVLISRGNRVLVHSGYGLASERPCVRAGPETVYHIGSLGKQFAAAAALRLEEQGIWRLADSVGTYFADASADKRAVTIHQLLTHSSGLPPDVWSYGAEQTSITRNSAVERLLDASIESAPGARYRYSNAGYALLTALIERASGEPFEEYARRELFLRAGLRRTGFVGEVELFDDGAVAAGFWGRYQVPPPAARPVSWALMPGDILSTVGDLARWYEALRSGRVLSPTSVDRMFTPQVADYGYGWHLRTREDGSTAVIFHNGDQGEHAVAFRHYPDSGLVTVAATNRVLQDAKQHDDVLNNALDVLAGASVDLPARPGARPRGRPPVGAYERDGGASFRISLDPAGGLWLAPESRDAFRVTFGHVPDFGARYDQGLARTSTFDDSMRAAMHDCDPALPPRWENVSPQYVTDLARMFCDLETALGAHRKTVLTGVQPLSWSRSRSLVFAHVIHERGRQAVTWLWEDQHPVEAWTSPAVDWPQEARLADGRSGSLVFDWFTGESVWLTSKTSDDGGVDVVIEHGEEAVRGRRRARSP